MSTSVSQVAAPVRVTKFESSIMTEKNLINSVETCVDECLYGFSKLHPNLELYPHQNVVFDKDSCDMKKASVISGGGSGHEPFPAGYVGKGMLTASVSGCIFASPPSNHILHAIRLTAEASGGVFVIIPNYTGDVLNFGLAIETALAEGIQVDSVIVGEDIAQEAYGISTKAGKRGMCGIVFIFKIAGYLARIGQNLETIRQLSTVAVRSMASLGLSLSACSKPGSGVLWRLETDEMDLGGGVHGEVGVARLPLTSAHEAVNTLLEFLLRRLEVEAGDEVVALVNNLGALTSLEQWLLAGEVEKCLSGQGISLARIYAGCFFTSLNMAGIQVCLLKLGKDTKNLFLEALDYQTEASAWPTTSFKTALPVCVGKKSTGVQTTSKHSKPFSNFPPEKAAIFKKCLLQIAEALIAEEAHLNHLDSACGDGDCGSTFSQMAREIRSSVDGNQLNLGNPSEVFLKISLLMQDAVGGTSGALYGLFCKGVGRELEEYKDLNDAKMFARSWKAGINCIKKYSSARLGDRTMLDPLETSCQVFEKELEGPGSVLEAFRKAVKKAEEACRSTKLMKATAGRASYTDRSTHTDVDAGACAVVVWLQAILRVLDAECTE